MSKAPTKDECV